MTTKILFRLFIQGVLLLHLSPCTRSSTFFFNATSSMQVSSASIPLKNGFDFSFRTCSGGVLLDQKGSSNGFVRIEVVRTTVNYTRTPVLFIPSHLRMTWKVNGTEESVTIGKDLDKNILHQVQFTPGSGQVNSTLTLSGLTTQFVQMPNTILEFVSSGPLYAGNHISGGEGFVGCITSGQNIPLPDSISVNVNANCPLGQSGCPAKVCPAGFTGYYCELNIDDCASAKCHHYSTCVDLVNNFSCSCGPRWTGQLCDIFLGSLCNKTNNNNTDVCKNGGVCRDTSDKNNYTCTCKPGYTGRNCENEFDPCKSYPCKQGGTCSKLSADDFKCDCPSGFKGKQCQENINDCAAFPCGHAGTCIDGINNYTCNCTGSGFTGPSCQEDINECNSTNKPCHPINTAQCINHDGFYQCVCKQGFNGKNCYEDLNDCRSDPCQNGGTCIDEVNSYRCKCMDGFTGTLCEINIDDCLNHNCNNNSICDDGVNNYTCVCKPGFNGSQCENDLNDHCWSVNCNSGTCKSDNSSFRCECFPGFNGTYCENEINECEGVSCNCGSCTDLLGAFRCDCDPWTTGRYCETDIDECANKSQCSVDKHQGICQNINITKETCDNRKKGAECYCTPGFTGANCQDNVDYCLQYAPCQNQANCTDGKEVNEYSCTCVSGWTGRNCDVDIDECQLGYCQNNATCNNTLGNYACACLPGFTDHNCSTNINDCLPDPCENGGNCTDLINGFTCACQPGYDGKNCSNNIDECESNPCQNNATCIDAIADVNCTCTANFTGKYCELELSSCIPNPCKNNGTCDLQNNNFTCTCAAGFGGVHCENITTVGLNGSSFMDFHVGKQMFELSFQFRTTLNHGLLGTDSGSNFLVFLDKNEVHVLYNNMNKLSAGKKASLSNGLWHTVFINISADSIILIVDNSSCGELCQTSSPLQAQADVSKLYIGGSSSPVNYLHNTLYNFTGCIQDVTIDMETVIPTSAVVELHNTVTGCPREEVCLSNPCANGQCIDEWIKFSCDCTRPWIGSRCNTTVTPGTFGATEPLNTGSSRRRRNADSMHNVSFAKFLTDGTRFDSAAELSFFIRTRELRGLIILMTDNQDHHISVVIDQGMLFVQTTSNGHTSNNTINGRVSDGHWHFVEIRNNMSRFDNLTMVTGPIVNKDITLTSTYLGGLDDFSLYPEADIIRTPFRGCLQDIQLNKKLFDFGFNDASLISTDRYTLLASSGLGEGCKGMNVCRSLPCGDGGYCKDLWNKYQCECKPRYGGPDCALYGCSLVNLCSHNTTCLDIGENYECVHPFTFNGSASRAEFTLVSSVNVSMDVSLRVRTRESSAVLIHIRQGYDRFFKMALDDGQINISFALNGDKGGISLDNQVNDGHWHKIMFKMTDNQSYLTVDGSTTIDSSKYSINEITSLLNNTSVVVGGSAFKGCIDNVRIGDLLLPFVDYYNSTLNVSHVTPLEPHFQVNKTELKFGCHSDDVCGPAPCVRGTCSDEWNLFNCACPEGWAGRICTLTANMTCAHSPCVNGTCSNLTDVGKATNQKQVSDVGFDMFECKCTQGFEGKLCENATNECVPDPCENGANCTDLHLDYNCTCPRGYAGKNCSTNIDECVNNNCTNNSTCVDGIGLYSCSCVTGFNGTFCEQDINECEVTMPLGPCNVSGTHNCSNLVGGYKCVCKQGFFGELCQYDFSMKCELDNPCQNGGNCSDNATAVSCSCPEGYNGTFCQNDIHECEDEPCMNNGTCIDSHVNSTSRMFPGYKCNCTNDFEGQRCEKKIDLCESEPCKNNATCERLAYNKYQCNCTPEYKGENCSIFRACYSRPCQNGATCNESYNPNNYSCSCPFGFYGRNCEKVIDYCSPDPCRNNATCVNLNREGKYFCNCTEGFGNINCSGLLTFCDPDPCINGNCTPLMDTFQCECNPGYTGKNCIELINKCDSNPCLNGGTCTSTDGSFRCECESGWVGETCQYVHPCNSSPCKNGATCKSTDQAGNFSCLCRDYFTGTRCEISQEPTDPSERSGGSQAILIGGSIAACIIAMLLFVLLVIVLKKRTSNGTYNPSKEELEAGRVELDSMLKPPPPERLI